jgi:hypothetical protein
MLSLAEQGDLVWTCPWLAPCRNRSMSAILSAPAAISATSAMTFAAGNAPTPSGDAGRCTRSATKAGRPHRCASRTSGSDRRRRPGSAVGSSRHLLQRPRPDQADPRLHQLLERGRETLHLDRDRRRDPREGPARPDQRKKTRQPQLNRHKPNHKILVRGHHRFHVRTLDGLSTGESRLSSRCFRRRRIGLQCMVSYATFDGKEEPRQSQRSSGVRWLCTEIS